MTKLAKKSLNCWKKQHNGNNTKDCGNFEKLRTVGRGWCCGFVFSVVVASVQLNLSTKSLSVPVASWFHGVLHLKSILSMLVANIIQVESWKNPQSRAENWQSNGVLLVLVVSLLGSSPVWLCLDPLGLRTSWQVECLDAGLRFSFLNLPKASVPAAVTGGYGLSAGEEGANLYRAHSWPTQTMKA